MKKVFLFTGVVFGVLVLSFVCFAATRDASLQVSSKPVIASLTGTTQAILLETRYPEFANVVGPMTAACRNIVLANSNARKPSTPSVPIWDGLTNPLPDSVYQIVPMNGNQVVIPERNRRDSKILVSWTLDLMAHSVQPDVTPLLQGPDFPACPVAANCAGCSSTQYLRGGNVYVQAFVNNVKAGEQLIYSLSGGMTRTWKVIPPPPPPAPIDWGDPTCSGTFTLDKTDFPGGIIPSPLRVELRWYNDSGVRVQAPANRRIINLLIEPSS
jgi:hypothetical protein